MAIVQLIDPQSGTVYNVEDKEAALAMDKNGLQLATPEQVSAYDAAKETKAKNETFGAQVVTGIEEAGRQVASGLAGAVRSTENFIQEKTGFGTAPGLEDREEGSKALEGADIAANLYTKSALERRKLNPTAASLGGAAAVAPLYTMGLPGIVAADALSAIGPEAVDAELEKRGIDGSTILANFTLNAALSGLSAGAPVAFNKIVKGSQNLAQRAVNAADARLRKSAQPMIDKRIEDLATSVDDLIKDPSVYPQPLHNISAQKQAIENVADHVAKYSEQDSGWIRTLGKDIDNEGSRSLYYRLNQLKDEVSTPEAIKALDDILQSKELWGDKIVNHLNVINKLPAIRPTAGASLEQVQNYIRTILELEKPGWEKLAKGMELIAEDKLMVSLDDLANADGLAKWLAKKSAKTGAQILAQAAGITAGGFTAGPVGALVGREIGGAAENLIKEPIEAAVESGLAKGLIALQNAARNESFKTARLMVNPELSRSYIRLGLAGGQALTPQAKFRGEYDTDVQAFQAHRKLLQDFEKDPMSLINTLSDEFGDVDKQAPNLYKSMVDQALKVSNFLQDKLPAARGVSMVRPDGNPPSPMQMRTWALYYTAATDPQSVLDSAKIGKAKREQIETLKALWPQQYNELREAVIENLASAKPTTTARQRLNILFNFGSALEPALSPGLKDKVAMNRSKVQESKGTSNMSAKVPPSKAGLTPGGMSALQLGPSLDQQL
jgi:hypothetical protein